MKLLALFAFVCTSASAFMPSVEAPGVVFYKHPDGNIVHRKAALLVPERGQGKVVLKAGGKSADGAAFATKKRQGRTVFSVVWTDLPGAPKDTAVLLRGTYLRGKNVASWYGDMLSRKIDPARREASVKEILESDDETLAYVGGFGFSAKVSP